MFGESPIFVPVFDESLFLCSVRVLFLFLFGESLVPILDEFLLFSESPESVPVFGESPVTVLVFGESHAPVPVFGEIPVPVFGDSPVLVRVSGRV